MRKIVDAAKEAGISAVIAADVAVMAYCNQIGQEVHLSTQLNISNAEALKFYSQFADVVVLARELNLKQVRKIYDAIQEQHITGPMGQPVRIEMFCHGALCMAVSGKCYLSLNELNASANRGACMQVCRRSYIVKDKESDIELEIDNQYIMSPKDLKTIHFMDEMIEAGVRVFKIEGRARGPEYVRTVVECYREAIRSYLEGTFTEEKKADWDTRLKTVFNRGFWNGYYLGQRLGEWSKNYGSEATERKVYAGRGIKYFSNIGVAEFLIEASEIKVGDKLLITGPTTGAMYVTLEEARVDLKPVDVVKKGVHVSFKVPDRIRPSDKLYRIVPADELEKEIISNYYHIANILFKIIFLFFNKIKWYVKKRIKEFYLHIPFFTIYIKLLIYTIVYRYSKLHHLSGGSMAGHVGITQVDIIFVDGYNAVHDVLHLRFTVAFRIPPFAINDIFFSHFRLYLHQFRFYEVLNFFDSDSRILKMIDNTLCNLVNQFFLMSNPRCVERFTDSICNL